MARDEMLDILGRQKRDANERRKVCKQLVDAAKRELDSYTPQIDSVQRDITSANSQREYHSTQAYHARREKDRFQAEYHTNQARSYASQAASHKRYKQDLIAKKQQARDRFNKALADLRFANSECNRLKDEFERQLAKVREQGERGRASRPSRDFGTGNTGRYGYTTNDGSGFTDPVHGTTDDGRPVTASFGTGRNEGETLIRRGHAESAEEFYGTKEQKEHDHFDQNGSPGKSGDRGKSD